MRPVAKCVVCALQTPKEASLRERYTKELEQGYFVGTRAQMDPLDENNEIKES